MRARGRLAACLAAASIAFAACGGDDNGTQPSDDMPATDSGADGTLRTDGGGGCTGGAKTTVSGTVYAPNGTLPVPGAIVYVPSGTTPPVLTHGVGGTCTSCTAPPVTDAVVQTTTDAQGRFSLEVPGGTNMPLTIQIGKWQRNLLLATAPAACTDTPLSVADTTLPASMRDVGGDTVSVDMPRIAVSTGFADALECLLRKLGIADSEFSTGPDGGPGAGRVTLYADNGATGGTGANKFATGFDGGAGVFADSLKLWSTEDELDPYDLVVLSCESGQHPETKNQTSLDALKAYADHGGRVLMSHWHNIWIGGAFVSGGTQVEPSWAALAQWSSGVAALPAGSLIDVNLAIPQGVALAEDLGLDAGGQFALTGASGRHTCDSSDGGITVLANADPATSGVTGPQIFEFTTPVEAPPSARCGVVAFTDVHMSADSSSTTGTPFPAGCSTNALTDQERAIAFILFGLGHCGS